MNYLKKTWAWLRADFHGVTVFLLVFMAVIFVGDHINHKFFQTDFKAYLQAAYRLPQGEAIYHREPGEISHMAYKYSPGVVFLFIPLTWVSVEAAKIIFFVLNCTVVFLLLHYAREFVTQQTKGKIVITQGQLFIAVLALGEFIYREIDIGNVNAICALLTVSSLWCVGKGSELSAGALLGLAALFKPHYSIFILFYLYFKKWRMAAAYAAVIFAGLLLPATIYGIQGNIDLHRAWLNEMTGHTAPTQWIHPWYGMNTLIELLAWPFRLLNGNKVVESVFYPIAVYALIAAGFVFFMRKTAGRGLWLYYPVFYVIGVTPLLMQVDINHFILLLPLILYLLAMWRSQTIVWKVAVAAGLILLGGNIYEVWGDKLHRLFYYVGVYGMGATLLLMALVFARLDRISEPA